MFLGHGVLLGGTPGATVEAQSESSASTARANHGEPCSQPMPAILLHSPRRHRKMSAVITARAVRAVFDAADRSRSRPTSVVEGSEELERPPRRTPTLCLMSTVVLGDAQHPGKLPERRVLLDLSIGACSAMHPHMLQ